MKKLAFTLALTVATGLFAVSAQAGGECGDKANYQDITLTGTISEQTKEVIDKHGKIKTVSTYQLTSNDITTDLPVHRNCSGVAAVDPAPHVGEVVTVRVRGIRKTNSGGKQFVYVAKLTQIGDPDSFDVFSSSNRDKTALKMHSLKSKSKDGFTSLRLEGRLVHRVSQKLNAHGEIQDASRYVLVTQSSEVELPAKIKHHSNMQSFVGEKVSVGVRGLQRKGRSGNTLTYVHELVSIDVANAAEELDPFSATNI